MAFLAHCSAPTEPTGETGAGLHWRPAPLTRARGA